MIFGERGERPCVEVRLQDTCSDDQLHLVIFAHVAQAL